MGNTWGASRDCPVDFHSGNYNTAGEAAAAAAAAAVARGEAGAAAAAAVLGGGSGGSGGKIGENEIITVRKLWAAIGDAVTPSSDRASVGARRTSRFASRRVAGQESTADSDELERVPHSFEVGGCNSKPVETPVETCIRLISALEAKM